MPMLYSFGSNKFLILSIGVLGPRQKQFWLPDKKLFTTSVLACPHGHTCKCNDQHIAQSEPYSVGAMKTVLALKFVKGGKNMRNE